jgi:hypothetical protein
MAVFVLIQSAAYGQFRDYGTDDLDVHRSSRTSSSFDGLTAKRIALRPDISPPRLRWIAWRSAARQGASIEPAHSLDDLARHVGR